MAETPKTRARRTWSQFGDVRKMPSEYEIMTHKANWTLREGRKAPFEQNPAAPANLWFSTYRDNSPLRVDDWDQFRDPDKMTYKTYVSMQDEQETNAGALLEQFAAAGSDSQLSPGWRRTLLDLQTPARYPLHGAQMISAYIAHSAPTHYVTNAQTFAAADLLRRVSQIAYRTRELQLAWPQAGFGSTERATWESDARWQPTRRAVEFALVTYDWAEAFTALNLVLLPTIDDILVRQLGEAARAAGDELTWLSSGLLQRDVDRRARWSTALARFAVEQNPDNAPVLQRWIDIWSVRADDAASGLAEILAASPQAPRSASEVTDGARAARDALTSAAVAAPANVD